MSNIREIWRRIQAATAKCDPSYKLKKKGLLNAHDMKRLIPDQKTLIFGDDDPIRVRKYEKNR